ncbi:MAG TPA: translocation/assembly module TamB domain-containing protein, partial [Burkholderiales bacterium]|nr:translocation/assembly module TamB domain-containing protein [Burkholderiales bacterium]
LTQEGIGLTAEVVRVGDTLEVRELGALAEGGAVNGTGRIHLQSMSFDAKLAVKAFNPAALGDYPAGSLSGTLSAAGTLEPRRVDLAWDLADSTLYEHVFQSKGSARVAGQRVAQADADLRLGANRLSARGAYGRPGDELALTLEAPRLEELAPISGSLRARGTLSGSLDNPRVALSAEAENLMVGKERISRATAKLAGGLSGHDLALRASAPELELEIEARLRGGWHAQRGWNGQVLSLKNSGEHPFELVAPATLSLAPGRVEIGRLEAKVGEGRLLVRDASWSRERLATSGEFSGLPAQWIVVAAAFAERLRSTLLLDGEWQITRAKQLEGHVRVRRAAGDLALLGDEPIELGLESAALELRFADGAAIAKADLASRVAKVALQGQITPALSVQGKVEFAELRALAGPLVEGAHVDGRLSAELRLSGTLKAPVFHGTLSGEKLLFEVPPWGIALKDGALKATLEGDSLRLDSFSIVGDKGGRLTASGMLPLGLDGTARLEWRAEKLHALSRPDRRLVVSGEGEASWDGKRAALKGDLRAEHGHFEFERTLPTLGDDVVVAGREAPRQKGSLKLPLVLELRLDFGTDLTVRGFGFDGKLTGLVDVATAKEGELRAFGRLQAVHATFLAYGQRLDVDPGVVIFDGPIDNPSLQITAWRRNQAVEAGVQISGTVRTPIVQLVSQPPVPEGERLSWLVLGRAPSGATQADLGMLQAAAGALLSGNESVPLDRRIARRFGLDEISLRGTGELTDRVVAVGKRLSDRVYISYEQGIDTVASNLVKLDYALGRRWTLRAETGTSSGGGLFYRYSWD